MEHIVYVQGEILRVQPKIGSGLSVVLVYNKRRMLSTNTENRRTGRIHYSPGGFFCARIERLSGFQKFYHPPKQLRHQHAGYLCTVVFRRPLHGIILGQVDQLDSFRHCYRRKVSENSPLHKQLSQAQCGTCQFCRQDLVSPYNR